MGNCHYTDGALHRTHLYRSHPGIAVHSHTWGLVEMVVDGGVIAFVFVAVCVKLIMFKVTRLFMWVFINTENQRTSKEPAGTLDRQGT